MTGGGVHSDHPVPGGDDPAPGGAGVVPRPAPVPWSGAVLAAVFAAVLPLVYTWVIGAESAWLLLWLPAVATQLGWYRSRQRHRLMGLTAGLAATALASVGAWAAVRAWTPDAWSLAIAAAAGAVAGCLSFAAVTRMRQ
jgi:hypothetical protein